MEGNFKPGDLLIYFNRDVSYVVLLDEVDESFFTIITSDDGIYQYGYKIRIKNLNDKFFMKIDTGFSIKEGHWETYDDYAKAPPHLLLSFSGPSQNSSTSRDMEIGSIYES